MTPLTFTVTPGDTALATARTTDAAAGDSGFGAALSRAMQGVIDTGHQADAKAMAAIGGHGDITQVVTAVSKAELALQATATIRDRMVQAYQDIMRMPI